MKGKIWQFLIFIIVSMLFQGCFSAMYSPRAVEPGKWQIGINAAYNPQSMEAGGIWFKRGLGAGFDLGMELRNSLFVPYAVGLNMRKEFSTGNNSIDKISFGAGGFAGLAFGVFGEFSLVCRSLAISLGVPYYAGVIPAFPEGSDREYSSLSPYLRISLEAGNDKVIIMPYIACETEVHEGFDRDIVQKSLLVSGGISIMFNIGKSNKNNKVNANKTMRKGH